MIRTKAKMWKILAKSVLVVRKSSTKSPKTNNQEMVEIITKIHEEQKKAEAKKVELSQQMQRRKCQCLLTFQVFYNRATENSPGCLYFHNYLLLHYSRRSQVLR